MGYAGSRHRPRPPPQQPEPVNTENRTQGTPTGNISWIDLQSDAAATTPDPRQQPRVPETFQSIDEPDAAAQEPVVTPGPTLKAPDASTPPNRSEMQLQARVQGLESKLEGFETEFAHFKERVSALEL